MVSPELAHLPVTPADRRRRSNQTPCLRHHHEPRTHAQSLILRRGLSGAGHAARPATGDSGRKAQGRRESGWGLTLDAIGAPPDGFWGHYNGIGSRELGMVSPELPGDV